MLGFTLSEQVGEVFAVEFGESLTIVDGLTDHEHCGEREVVVMNNLRQIF